MYTAAKAGMMQRADKMNITFVCTGNTCRSAMAEGICKKILTEKKIKNISCQSCGLGAFNGDEASPLAVEAAKKHGADISAHRARQLNRYIFDETDLMICMTSSHKAAIMSLNPKFKVLVPSPEISDPYGGNAEIYSRCADQLEVFISRLIDALTAEINPMSSKHISKIAEIEKQCFSAPWTEKGIAEELNNPNAHFIVAETDNKVLGYIGVHEVCDEAYIDNIAVLPDYRRLGMGVKLLLSARDGAFKRGCSFISLEVRKSNLAAISLYSKLGFKNVGERKNFYTDPQEDAVIMTLKECDDK